MLKHSLLCMIICGLLVLPLVVRADILIEPTNNFYEKNSEKCVLLGRNFCFNGEEGQVSIKDAPYTQKEVATFKNGENIYVEYSCLYDGEYWGIVTYDNSGHAGWVEMNQLLVLYDYVAFAEEHFSEFYQYTGDFNEMKVIGEAIIWTWPGSGNSRGVMKGIDVENFSVLYAFLDDHGREWGFVSYLFGSRNFWICLSEPINQDIPNFNPRPEPTKWVTDTVHTDIKQDNNQAIMLVTALVVALVTGTAILIKIFWEPQGKSRARR